MPEPETPSPEPSDPERERVRAAIVSLVAEHGFEETSDEMVAARAELEPAEFSRRFSDKQACIDWVWEEMTDEYIGLVKDAYAAAGNWRDGLRAGAFAALRFLQSDPQRARFFLVEVLAGGELVQARRDLMMNTFVDMIDQGRQELDNPEFASRAKAEAVTGAIYGNSILAIQQRGVEAGPQLVQEMMFLVVQTYVSADAAQEELDRAPEYIARYERGEL